MATAVVLAPQGLVNADGTGARAKLVYERGSGAQLCPDEDAVRSMIVRRIRRDPFAAEASLTLTITISRDDMYRALVRVTTPAGESRGQRHLQSSRDCRVLVRAVALAVVLLLENDGTEAVPDPAIAEPVTDAHDLAAPAYPTTPGPVVVTRDRVDHAPAGRRLGVLESAFGMGAQGGLLPAPSAVVSAQVLLRRTWHAVFVEAGWAMPGSTGLAGGRITASLMAGTLGGCVVDGQLGVCLQASAGRMQVRGDGYSMSDSGTVRYLASGLRLWWEGHLGAGIRWRAQSELLGTLLRARLRVTGDPAGEWTAPPGSLGLTVALVARFR